MPATKFVANDLAYLDPDMSHMSVTHGARSRQFRWKFAQEQLLIENENGLKHSFSLHELSEILASIHAQFGDSWFPLANNVEKMAGGSERAGLGMAIFRLNPGNTLHAQGSSYLGVVLEEVGIFAWNGKSYGIEWRLINHPPDTAVLRAVLIDGVKEKI